MESLKKIDYGEGYGSEFDEQEALERSVYFKKMFCLQIIKDISFFTFIHIFNRKKTWRDDELSGIKRKSNSTDGLPSKRMVSREYSRYDMTSRSHQRFPTDDDLI